ncbi:DUF3025 domain-containing protein [Alteromonas ponticola]|uniref:DUF3025 domain-containing protein n=1 Tax=Alteromonas aquimaris TaxID=2998417 RepID=A0ABT3P4S4_9ALTE|nr:DUF3025 domain-containing protein [Alteromonas aquimaris]MCW8107765.1 DUF3025 domain-containing protein [Alteromonas aquimaris]
MALKTSMMDRPLHTYNSHYGLFNFQHFPNVEQLNQLATRVLPCEKAVPAFKANRYFAEDKRYYEEIICQSQVVPTRENNWHDFFNALIWMQFPKTKRLFSELHQQDIAEFGLNPRTRRRNHITHFDECGVIIAIPSSMMTEGNALLTLLANHDWERVFQSFKDCWHRVLFPIVFGHAMLEMMLQPFIGLTAKWLAVEVSDEFAELSFGQRNHLLDQALMQRVQALGHFDISHPLKPLPVLGVPGWYQHQSHQFYLNKAYFRPSSRTNEWPEYILL